MRAANRTSSKERMMFKEITEAMRMQMAHDIAHGASLLDGISANVATMLTHDEYIEAKSFVEKLHDIAMTLCGSRVLEVYGPEEVMEPFPQATEQMPAGGGDADALQQEAV